ncbi:TPA: LysR family transcriptional regulator, partial [Streptococcus agalactiae]|nr:LysR family transcriptional regulator [Streptococcus agalactiae]
LDSRSVNGITVIPLEDHLDNQMIYIKRKDRNLSQMALKFVAVMEEYFKGFNS